MRPASRVISALILLVAMLLLRALPSDHGAIPTLAQPASTTEPFEYTGTTQTWTVPAGVTQATFDVHAAQGGPVLDSSGGRGGRALATLAVSPGATVTIWVGGAGSAGNCSGSGASLSCDGGDGGDSSDVRIGGTERAQRVLVAGGGGGASRRCAGGGGGGSLGATAPCAGGGAGGNQDGSSGSGQLGDGSSGADGNPDSGGGGGGGYYGGAGGAAGSGGGGGSGFGPMGVMFETGARQGNGRVTVTFTPQPPPTITSITPTHGPEPGGTVVTITGHNLTNADGPTAVSFGGTPATTVRCSSAATCEATSPPGTGTVSVRVTVEGQSSADTAADDFTYEP
ncbi:MAG: IPT/TIG domain-containing protein, partial [Dehalococcoidia bacterium]